MKRALLVLLLVIALLPRSAAAGYTPLCRSGSGSAQCSGGLNLSAGGFGVPVHAGLTDNYVAIVVGGAITVGPLLAAALPAHSAALLTSGTLSASRLPIIPQELGGFGQSLAGLLTTPTELGYVHGVTGPLQAQLDLLIPASSTRLPPAPSGAGKVLYDTGSAYAAAAAGTGTQVLHGGSAISFSSVALAADVSGTLPEGNGGFGASLSGIGTGIIVRSAANTPLARSLVAGIGTTVTNGNGSAGNPAVNITYGTTSSTATQGNDTRLPPLPGTTGSGLFDNGSGWVRLALGTSGQAYVAGAGGFPQWESRPAVVVSGQTVGALPTGVSYLVARGGGLATSGTSGFLSVGTRSSMRAKNLYCTGSSLVAGSSVVVAMYTGAGASVLTCTITEPSVSCNDTTNNPAVSAGNGVNIQVTSSATQGAGYALTCAFDINIGAA